MQSTLIHIPHADPFFNIPLFGLGWALLLVAVAGVITVGLRVKERGWNSKALSDLPVLLILAAAAFWVAPLLEEQTAAGQSVGVPIRAYGVMMLIGIVTGVLFTMHQGSRSGIEPDTIFSLCFWMIVGGFLGARAFYVIEYWDQFADETFFKTLGKIVNLSDGGLVVYGSFFGASIAILVFVYRYKLPILPTADLIAPGLMLGVALGRVGCLMNGCCWGGICEERPIGITFPQGSPPFIDQLERGILMGIRLEKEPERQTQVVREVSADSLAARRGIKPGDRITQIEFPTEEQLDRMRSGKTVPDAVLTVTLADGRMVSWEFGQLPGRSKRVYPTQILSSVNAAMIFFFLWAYYPMRRRDGEVAALLASVYPITRVLLEMIRTDEETILASDYRFTISQAVSVTILALVVGFWIFILKRPRGSVLPMYEPTGALVGDPTTASSSRPPRKSTP